jgi:DNA mismatch repair ATPase MutS
LLDELGRGTSTADGLAIANAVSDALLTRAARCLFATHYHTLTAVYAANSRVALWKMAVAVNEQRVLTPLVNLFIIIVVVVMIVSCLKL